MEVTLTKKLTFTLEFPEIVWNHMFVYLYPISGNLVISPGIIALDLEIIVRVFIQVQHISMMSLLQHTKLLLNSRDSIFLELWIVILEALEKCIVKKLKLLQLFLGWP